MSHTTNKKNLVLPVAFLLAVAAVAGYQGLWASGERAGEFWDDLDIVGMTTYYDLTGGKKPTVETLVEAWKPIRKEILQWQAKINRPILFTEVGWPNQVTCAQYPWDYYRSPDQPDPEAQANCFEAFFRIWANEPQTSGWLVWEWRTSLDQKPDEKDTSYNPEGKPAMAVIKKYFGHTKDTAQSEPPPPPAADDSEAVLSPADDSPEEMQ
jgi:hypothetical protein